MELDIHTFTRLALGLAGTIFGFVAANVFLKIRGESDQAMVSFQLKPEQAERDFKILLAGSILMLAGFFFYFVGGLTVREELLTAGRFASLLFSLFPIAVFIRWWRRF